LSLLVLRHLANHPYNPVALDDLALIAYFFDAGSNFHINFARIVRLYSCPGRGIATPDGYSWPTQEEMIPNNRGQRQGGGVVSINGLR
jgi:hypothetical protein